MLHPCWGAPFQLPEVVAHGSKGPEWSPSVLTVLLQQAPEQGTGKLCKDSLKNPQGQNYFIIGKSCPPTPTGNNGGHCNGICVRLCFRHVLRVVDFPITSVTPGKIHETLLHVRSKHYHYFNENCSYYFPK